jgi:hypothetical protein
VAVQAITEDEISEVLIGGHDQSSRLFGLIEPDNILLPWGRFCGVENVISPLPQPLTMWRATFSSAKNFM